jgi:RNA polymerase sigma-70 factor (ECF subfamily)
MEVRGTDDGDPALIAAAQRGERSALDAFVRRHDRWVRNLVYATTGDRAGVDDVVQHVWVNVWRQIGTLVDPTRWRGWLYRMAKNAAIDVGIKTSRERRRRMELRDDRPAVRQVDPAQSLIASEEHQRVLKAVNGLSPIYREPFILRHLEDWTYAQIGEALGLPVDTVETRLVRARRQLRAALASRNEKES